MRKRPSAPVSTGVAVMKRSSAADAVRSERGQDDLGPLDRPVALVHHDPLDRGSGQERDLAEVGLRLALRDEDAAHERRGEARALGAEVEPAGAHVREAEAALGVRDGAERLRPAWASASSSARVRVTWAPATGRPSSSTTRPTATVPRRRMSRTGAVESASWLRGRETLLGPPRPCAGGRRGAAAARSGRPGRSRPPSPPSGPSGGPAGLVSVAILAPCDRLARLVHDLAGDGSRRVPAGR